jgi:Flp pilus assembly protein TadD
MRIGRDDDAVAAFRKVVAVAPDHGDTRLDLGLLLRSRGDLDGAVAALREARRILPEQGSYAMALGMTYARLGDLDAALVESNRP